MRPRGIELQQSNGPDDHIDSLRRTDLGRFNEEVGWSNSTLTEVRQ